VVRAPGRIDFRQKGVSGVGAVVAGRVSKLYVQPGDQVRAGTTIVTLSSPDAAEARAKLSDAYAQLQSAEEMFKRQVEMLKRGVGLEMDRFKAEIELREARAEFQRANQAVTFLGEGSGETVNIKAPISGRVVHIKATVGAMAEPGETLMELGNPASLWVVADVFDRDLVLVREGAAALVEIASNPKPLQGRVAVIGAALEGESRRAPVFIELHDQNISLRPGMYARVSITALSSDRITVPVAAVLIKGSENTVVYVEKADGAFENRKVVIGQSIDGYVPILQGLSVGERVVVNGALLLDAEAEQLL
jgi:cobalt-zinc-cadmium efflux system membrane fusion protein